MTVVVATSVVVLAVVIVLSAVDVVTTAVVGSAGATRRGLARVGTIR